jgi:ABC-type multidrug transport system fused ATPase/permease subunit
MLALRTNLLVEIGWSLVVPVALAVAIWYAGTRILTDADLVAMGLLSPDAAFTTGQLVTLLFYLALLLEPLTVLASTAGHSQRGLAALERVLNLLEEERVAGSASSIRGDACLRSSKSAWTCRRDTSSRSWDRAEPASPRSVTSSPVSTSRPRAWSSWTASISGSSSSIPELIEYGSISKLTASGGGSNTDGMGGSKGKGCL